MTKSAWVATLFILVGVGAGAQDSSLAQDVTEATSPLPAELQAGAAVIRYDSAGRKTVLREGTNHMVCAADSPFAGFSATCYPKSLLGYRDRMEELWEKSEEEFGAIINSEIKQGKLKIPDRTVFYAVRGAEFQNALFR